MMLHVSHRFHTRANDLMITKAARCALGPRAPGWQTSASNINTIDDGRIESSANCLPFSESCEPEEAVEKAAARICREGGGRVTTNTRLADLNPLHRGHSQRISHAAGKQGGSAYHFGVAPHQVRRAKVTGKDLCRSSLAGRTRNKERTYPEFLHNRTHRLMVLGGGRWRNGASNFISMLAKTRARPSPRSLRTATTSALVSPWSAFLTHVTSQPVPSLPAYCLKICRSLVPPQP